MGDLAQIISYKILQAQADLQSLAMSPVFSEFPASVRELGYRLTAWCPASRTQHSPGSEKHWKS